MPSPPTISIQASTGALPATSVPRTAETTAASGPMELATSFEPWAKATAQAVMIWSTTKTRSTARKRRS